MRTLIFDPLLTGHHIEYLHYLWNGAVKRPDREFVFAVPKNGWDKALSLYDWPQNKNITLRFLNDDEVSACQQGGLMRQSYCVSKLVKNISKEVNANDIFLIFLTNVIPFLPFMLKKGVKVSGIIYKIYLRNCHLSVLRKCVETFRYLLMAKSKSVRRILILNDSRSAQCLNDKFHTSKFIPLADPVPSIDPNKLCNLRAELNIDEMAKVYLHFGAMDGRKGTLEILKAINMLKTEDLVLKVFIFAGKINKNIISNFENLKESALNKGAQIIVFNDFVSYDFLNSLCHTSDYILIPYLITDLSSGALGYAAVHGVPVIGPASGLIGELIQDNHLGVTLSNINMQSITDAIINCKVGRISHEYADKNSITCFIKSIFEI